MHVLFVEPAFPRNQREFVRALHEVGAHVTAIGEAPAQALDGELKSWLHGYEQVPSVTNGEALYETVKKIQEREWVDRLESTVEAHTMPVAHVREACEIPGTSTRTSFLCRDKPAMKDALREAGVPTAQSIGATTPEEVHDFVAKEGYPVILKPRDAAGAAGTYKCDDEEQLENAIRDCGLEHGAPTAVEEYVEGHEAFYDTLSIEGKPVHEFVSHYYPGVLDAMRTRWITPQIVITNRLDTPEYEEVRELGQKVVDALGIGTSATHMEWFFGPKGLKFSEIGCRPPGVRVWDIYGAINDMDLYVEWAKAIVHGQTDTVASRRFAGAMTAHRPDQDGTISGVDGFDQVQRQYGSSILDYHFPNPGTPTQPVEGGYMANGWIRWRHPDYDELRGILDRAAETIQVRAR